MSKNRSNCLCTAMLYEPKNVKKAEQKKRSSEFKKNLSLFERLINIKRAMFLNFAKGKKAIEKVKDKVN